MKESDSSCNHSLPRSYQPIGWSFGLWTPFLTKLIGLDWTIKGRKQPSEKHALRCTDVLTYQIHIYIYILLEYLTGEQSILG